MATFYNRYKKEMLMNQKGLVEFLKDHVPKTVTVKLDVPAFEQPQDAVTTARQTQEVQQRINLDLWVKSYEQNPNPSELHTVQVSSVKELLARCQQLAGADANGNQAK